MERNERGEWAGAGGTSGTSAAQDGALLTELDAGWAGWADLGDDDAVVVKNDALSKNGQEGGQDEAAWSRQGERKVL